MESPVRALVEIAPLESQRLIRARLRSARLKIDPLAAVVDAESPAYPSLGAPAASSLRSSGLWNWGAA
jgi:hypothetical protein